MSLLMKFFRWMLSHLTLIVVLSLILYFYWNRNELWLEDSHEAVAVLGNETGPIEPTEVAVSSFSDAVPNKNENQPTSEKSIVKYAIIKKERQKTLLYPSDIDAGQSETDSFTDSDNGFITQDLSQEHSENHNRDNNPVPDGFSERKRLYEQKLFLAESGAEKKSNEVLQPPQIEDDTTEFSESSELKITSSEVPENVNSLSFQDKKLQQQIRTRQKKLSKQMVSLISVTMEQAEVTVDQPVIDIEPVNPVIKTPEQRQLVLQARQAFEQRNFKLAEEKYLQLMNQLPELPDVVGELANVYKTQKRQSDYIAMSTSFVKRLVDHYRFDEAWRVVTEIAKIDKNIANKQRRIIYKKQQDLELY